MQHNSLSQQQIRMGFGFQRRKQADRSYAITFQEYSGATKEDEPHFTQIQMKEMNENDDDDEDRQKLLP